MLERAAPNTLYTHFERHLCWTSTGFSPERENMERVGAEAVLEEKHHVDREDDAKATRRLALLLGNQYIREDRSICVTVSSERHDVWPVSHVRAPADEVNDKIEQQPITRDDLRVRHHRSAPRPYCPNVATAPRQQISFWTGWISLSLLVINFARNSGINLYLALIAVLTSLHRHSPPPTNHHALALCNIELVRRER